MTDQLTDNEVIARFMGYEYQIEEWCGSNILKDDLFSETGKSMQPFNPDEDWRELMPVWYKFRDLKIDIKDGLLAYHFRCDNITKEILNGGPSPLEACKLLAEGIRWYNSTTQNNGK